MDQPGVTVTPILTMAGDHEVNQVFLDKVRTPVANRIGPENAGWTVAKYLLEFERGNAYAPGLRHMLNKARKIASMAEAWHLPVAPRDCTGPVVFAASIHLALNAPNAVYQESVRAYYTSWYRDLVTVMPRHEMRRLMWHITVGWASPSALESQFRQLSGDTPA